MPEKQLQQLAFQAGIGIYPLSDYRLDYFESSQAQLSIGFGGIPVHVIEQSIEQLMDCWGIQKNHPSTTTK
ncbi:hypothetical protein [Lysinibacillus sp. D4B1_S16]|uniref:hypothetical protein n=1 Tax=Lysinibacillus sp. D4B1_S16 TaxID=2941231 RepID=UPI0020BFF191|nr:hypothetical protein [Lysinibacillus sp. D4B1_S16]